MMFISHKHLCLVFGISTLFLESDMNSCTYKTLSIFKGCNYYSLKNIILKRPQALYKENTHRHLAGIRAFFPDYRLRPGGMCVSRER